MKQLVLMAACLLCLAACKRSDDAALKRPWVVDSLPAAPAAAETLIYDDPAAPRINTGIVKPEEVVVFAQTLKGIPYQYASCDPKSGFDCSGFIYYVFDHFHIQVPRSSADFTRLGREVDRKEAKPGDLILFTGTNPVDRTVGHMGLVLSNIADSLVFIHSSSGSANSVTVTPLNEYYQGRFVKLIRIFPQNES